MPEISACTATDLPGLLRDLDDEFITNKGRTGGLAARFPRLFSSANLQHILVARSAGLVVAAAASQSFTFVDAGVRWRCAGIGAVWTRASSRGGGLASALMRALVDLNAKEQVDALVLWTSLHGFYGPLGWRLDDVGLLGTAPGLSSEGIGTGVQVVPRPVLEWDLAELERIRQQHLSQWVERPAIAWSTTPIPATSVAAFVTDNAYALVGTDGNSGYVYELIGEKSEFAALWNSIRTRYGRLFVNESVGGTAAWLEQYGGMTFTPQRLAMWMPLSPDAVRLAGRFHIPYLDRV